MQNKAKNILIVLLAMVIIALVVFLFFKNNKGEDIIKEEVKNDIVLTDLEDKIKIESREWYIKWIGEDTGSNLSMFIKNKNSEDVPMRTDEYTYNPEENTNKLKKEYGYYIYSPDKTKILDPKGYMELAEKDGRVEELYDVDSSVKLIDLKTNKEKYLLTCGTPCGFSDAFWLDNDSLVVLGSIRDFKNGGSCKIYDECTYPSLYTFDLKNNRYTSYYGPEIEMNMKREIAPTENNQISKNTYTYKNHGFTIEIPKGYTVKEEKVVGMPYATKIRFEKDTDGTHYSHTITYISDVKLRESQKGKISVDIDPYKDYRYIGDEKIGTTTFKVYRFGGPADDTIYSFTQGNVGYEVWNSTKELLETFKFVGWN